MEAISVVQAKNNGGLENDRTCEEKRETGIYFEQKGLTYGLIRSEQCDKGLQVEYLGGGWGPLLTQGRLGVKQVARINFGKQDPKFWFGAY